MAIRVEFYGLARQRAGVPALELDCGPSQVTLGAVLIRLAERLPEFGRECVDRGRLRPTFAANVAGQRFISDATARLNDGECLLILSADAGG